jgi:hypothetical protein
VTGHIAPHRWADLWAGRIPESEREVMDAHADRCRACGRARERVKRASDSFAGIRNQVAPEIGWDSVRARVHWSVSKARNEQARDRSSRVHVPRLAWSALAVAIAGGLAVVTPSADPGERTQRSMAHPANVPAPATPAAVVPAVTTAPLHGLVTRVTGPLLLNGRRADVFRDPLVAGTVIATEAGHVDVQFGIESAFSLGPTSSLELRRFDESLVELVVDGTIDVALARRAPGQRFVVIAGDRTIEVRGTQFRVQRDRNATTVSCHHGFVVVTDKIGSAPIAVGKARRVVLAAARPLGEAHVESMSADELSVLARATPMALPSITRWEDHQAVAASSAPLEITTPEPREVRIDGVEVGVAPLTVRVMAGRHTVDAADHAGRFRRAGWVDVATASSHPARLAIRTEHVSSHSLGERPRQLHAGIDRARLRSCTRSIAKAGLTGTYVEVELAVDAQGAVGFLNVIDTDLPSATARCVRDTLADVRFGPGTAATWRERVNL